MAAIQFTAAISSVNEWNILQLPKEASAQLPSRGLTMVEGTLNTFSFKVALEPDGVGSHWFKIDDTLRKQANVKTGDTVRVTMESTKDWPEPSIPADLQKALTANVPVQAIWGKLTPMARWDWIRWISSTKQAATRQRRIEVTFSKLDSGSRRPCCFNRSECTVPEVSHSGKLAVATPLL